MQQLIRTEWMKVRTYKAFWIMAGIFVVAAIGLNYIIYVLTNSIHEQTGKTAGDALLGKPFSFPDVWNTVSWLSGWLLFIPGMIIITLISNEYTFRTHRQNIIDGWTRAQFISVKLLWVVSLSALVAVVAFATALVFGFIAGTPFSGGIEYIGYFFLESLSYLMAALLVGVLIKRAGLAIGLYFLYIFVLKYLIVAMVNRENTLQIGSYIPLNITDKLIPFPFIKDAVKRAIQPPPPVYVLLMGSLAYLGLFYWWMLHKFRTDDL